MFIAIYSDIWNYRDNDNRDATRIEHQAILRAETKDGLYEQIGRLFIEYEENAKRNPERFHSFELNAIFEMDPKSVIYADPDYIDLSCPEASNNSFTEVIDESMKLPVIQHLLEEQRVTEFIKKQNQLAEEEEEKRAAERERRALYEELKAEFD